MTRRPMAGLLAGSSSDSIPRKLILRDRGSWADGLGPMATPPDKHAAPDARFRVLNRIGMIDMLSAAMATRLLKPVDLTASLFGLLNHFAERAGEPKSVTALARDLQVPQPGVTKRVQKLIARGLLQETPSPHDARKKFLTITPEGQAVHARAIGLLVPPAIAVFDGWSDAEVEGMLRLLERLKATLDRMI